MKHVNSMMLYVHIPFCVKKCGYCDFLSFPGSCKEERTSYVEALLREIESYAPMKEKFPSVSSVFIGGGTPSILEGEDMIRIIGGIRGVFTVEEEAEITCECNPGTVTLEKAKAFREAGINRISVGVQSFDNELLKKLGRIHDRSQALRAMEIFREAGFENISLDLMMGLPEQSTSKYLDSIREAASLGVSHISAYSLILEEGTPFYEKMDELALPEEDEEREMYTAGRDLLEDLGYERYEISNYARKGAESRHNCGYWVRRPYLGLGLGSSSMLPGILSETGEEFSDVRFKNTADLSAYLEHSAHHLKIREEIEIIGEDEKMSETMILGLRMTKGVSLNEFRELYGKELREVYAETIEKHLKNGLLKIEDECIRLTDKGFDLANVVMADFL